MIKEDIRFSDSTVFEGMISVSAVINSTSNDRKINKILFDKSKVKQKERELHYLRHKSTELGFEIELADSDDLNKYAIGTSHGGIIAFCSERTIPDISDFEIKENGFYVFLCGIEDPYNFGYALRSLYAAGVDGIVLSRRNWLTSAGVVCRSSAGASEKFNICTCEGADAVEAFRKRGYSIVCADIKNSSSIYETEIKKPVFLIVGGEKRGISQSIISLCDKVVRIDYGREFKEALSAASAASVIAFEIMRQNIK